MSIIIGKLDLTIFDIFFNTAQQIIALLKFEEI